MTISIGTHSHVQGDYENTVQTPDIDTTGTTNQLIVSTAGHSDVGGGANSGLNFNDISDNLGNVFLPIHGVWDASQVLGVLAWGCHNPTVGSAHHITKVDGKGAYAGICFLSLSGVYSGALTTRASITNSGTGTYSGGTFGSLSVTPPQDGSVVVVASLEAGTISGGGFSSWTESYSDVTFVSYGGGLTAIVQSTAATSSPSIATAHSPPVTALMFSMAPATSVTDAFTYSYKRSISINHAKFSADAADFTVMVKGTYTDLKSVSNGGHVQSTSGHDIVFYSDSSLSNRLSYEQAKYDPTTGDIIYWVKVPAVSATTDTVIYLAYGDATASATRSNPTRAWDVDFAAVYHFGDSTTLNYNDSTEYQGTLWAASGAPAATAGKINGGVYFDGTSFLRNESIQLGSQSSVTVSFWVNQASADVQQSAAFSIGRSQDVRCSAHCPWEDGVTYWDYGVGFSSPGARLTWSGLSTYYNSWVRMSFVYDRTNNLHAIYANGVLVASFTSSVAPLFDLGTMDVGGWGATSTNNYSKAKFDEFTVSRASRSANWLRAEYYNQDDPATFYTMGSETSAGGGGTAALTGRSGSASRAIGGRSAATAIAGKQSAISRGTGFPGYSAPQFGRARGSALARGSAAYTAPMTGAVRARGAAKLAGTFAVSILGRARASAGAKLAGTYLASVAGKAAARARSTAAAGLVTALAARAGARARVAAAPAFSAVMAGVSRAATAGRLTGTLAVAIAGKATAIGHAIIFPGAGVRALIGTAMGMSRSKAAPSAAVAIAGKSSSASGARPGAVYMAAMAGVAKARSTGQLLSGAGMRFLVGLAAGFSRSRAAPSATASVSGSAASAAHGKAAGGFNAAVSGKSTAAAHAGPGAAYRAVLAGMSKARSSGRAALPGLGIALVGVSKVMSGARAAVMGESSLFGRAMAATWSFVTFARTKPLDIDPGTVLFMDETSNEVIFDGYVAEEIIFR